MSSAVVDVKICPCAYSETYTQRFSIRVGFRAGIFPNPRFRALIGGKTGRFAVYFAGCSASDLLICFAAYSRTYNFFARLGHLANLMLAGGIEVIGYFCFAEGRPLLRLST